ncbi:MAG: hypothetical protein IPO08_19595 [Xanthomonadales bacterium]|nr:hypothetical protein [Xanthomonadales bacterium]
MENRNCRNCRFWRETPRSDVLGGDCCIRAPSIVMGHLNLISGGSDGTDAATIGFWPGTDEDDWCGEFVER